MRAWSDLSSTTDTFWGLSLGAVHKNNDILIHVPNGAVFDSYHVHHNCYSNWVVAFDMWWSYMDSIHACSSTIINRSIAGESLSGRHK